MGWTYQSNNPPSQSPTDPSELIYPGGAGELVTNNPNACWYNPEVMTGGSTPDNVIMSQFRDTSNHPVLRAGSTLRNDSCWAYKSGWKSAEEISPVDYVGAGAEVMGTQAEASTNLGILKEGYTPATEPGGYNNHDYSWFPKPAIFQPEFPYGLEFDSTGKTKGETRTWNDPMGNIHDEPVTGDDIYDDDAQPRPTQQFYSGGWNGGYIQTPGQYTVTARSGDDGVIPNFSLSWLGGCNPITSTSNEKEYSTFNSSGSSKL